MSKKTLFVGKRPDYIQEKPLRVFNAEKGNISGLFEILLHNNQIPKKGDPGSTTNKPRHPEIA